jgi:hypothetical protein
MFDTSLIAYGLIRIHFFNKKYKYAYFMLFFLLASLSHGFYDFWLIYEETSSFGWIITTLYFLVTISIFSTVLNNALNNSKFFTYKKVVSPNKVAGRILLYYSIVYATQYIMITYKDGIGTAFGYFVVSLFTSGFVIIISAVRLSRFKLIKNKWNRIKLEFPFYIT